MLRGDPHRRAADEMRDQRLLIEARALSDLGRHDFALEVIDGIEGREAIRLRADIYWAARRWQKAAEQIELLYGDRWKSFEPLTDAERSDILRAGVGYALADDKLGIGALARPVHGRRWRRAGPPRLRGGERADRHGERRVPGRGAAGGEPRTRSTASCAICARAIRRRRLPGQG